jgi:hypothetical protein
MCGFGEPFAGEAMRPRQSHPRQVEDQKDGGRSDRGEHRPAVEACPSLPYHDIADG